MEVRSQVKQLLKDYSLEEILERGELEVEEAIYLLVVYGALDIANVIEGTDTEA